MILFCAIIVTLFLPAAPIAPTHTSLRSGLASLDWAGTILLIGSVTTLLLGFSFRTSYLEPWSAPVVWGNLLASVLGLVAFGLVETRVKSPLVPMRILRSKHRLAIMSSGLFLSIGNQAFVSDANGHVCSAANGCLSDVPSVSFPNRSCSLFTVC